MGEMLHCVQHDNTTCPRRNGVKTIDEVPNRLVTLVNTGRGMRTFDLRAGDDILGKLEFGPLNSFDRAEAADGRWMFVRNEYLTRVKIGALETGTQVATYTAGWLCKGMLEFTNGHRFQWKCNNLLGTTWAWKQQGGAPLLSFSSILSWRTEVQVALMPVARSLPELSLLALLGSYLLLELYGGGVPLPRWLAARKAGRS